MARINADLEALMRTSSERAADAAYALARRAARLAAEPARLAALKRQQRDHAIAGFCLGIVVFGVFIVAIRCLYLFLMWIF